MYPNEKNMFLPIALSAIVSLNGVGITFSSLINGTGDILTGLNGVFYFLLFIAVTAFTLFAGEAFNKRNTFSKTIESDVDDIWNSL